MKNIKQILLVLIFLIMQKVYSQTITFEQLLALVSHRDKETGAITSLLGPSAVNDTIKNYCLCYSENLWFDIQKFDDSTYLVETGLIGNGTASGCIPDTICGGSNYTFKKTLKIDQEFKRISKYKSNKSEENIKRLERIRFLSNGKLKNGDSYCTVLDSLGFEFQRTDITIFNVAQGFVTHGILLKNKNICLLFHVVRMYKTLYDIRRNFDGFGFNLDNSEIGVWDKITDNRECKK